jgi:hypothetical protein
MPTKHGEPPEKLLKESRGLNLEDALSSDHSHLRITLQHLGAMRGGLDIGGQVPPGMMAPHVDTTFPQLALRDVINSPIVNDVYRPAILPVERNQFL